MSIDSIKKVINLKYFDFLRARLKTILHIHKRASWCSGIEQDKIDELKVVVVSAESYAIPYD